MAAYWLETAWNAAAARAGGCLGGGCLGDGCLGDGRSARSAALADLRHEAVDIRLVVHIVPDGTPHRLEPAARDADAAAGAGGGAAVDALGDAANADFPRVLTLLCDRSDAWRAGSRGVN